MDENLKNSLLNMKESGLSYSQISASTGLSINTIKSCLRRNAVATEKNNVCKNCGENLGEQPRNGMKKFCSEKCKCKWWGKNMLNNRKHLIMRVCEQCGKSFRCFDRKNRKFCSRKCYANYRFKNQKVVMKT